MFEYSADLPRMVGSSTRRQLWQPFLDRLSAERWGYIRRHNWRFQEREKNLQRWHFREWLWCVRCFNQFKVVPGSIGWLYCPACGFWV